ncbi:MAG: glycerol-3-phosphate acyltransferase [bacterium]|nr:glycerol-3-phosphate acyltransferase [bacterium]
MYNLLAILLQFLSGSIMYSYILAKISNVNLREVRDGNPGSSNLWRVKGWKLGVLALILDYLKGIFPLAVFISIGLISNKYIIAISALCGILGHAFSPMLRFKGGKAIATTFGAWSVLTRWEGPTILGVTFTVFTLIKPKATKVEEDAFRVLLGFIALIPYVLYNSYNGKDYLLYFYVGNLLIIGYKHWNDWASFFRGLKKG